MAGSTPRRPASARPRAGAEHDATPPSAEELEAIERQYAELARQAGADVADDAALGLVWVRAAGRGPGLNHATCIRWAAADVDARLQAVVQQLVAAGEWPVVTLAEGLTRPPDLAERLAAAGWTQVGGERILWTRHPAIVPHLDRGFRVEAVTPASAPDCVRLETANFGLQLDGIGERAERLARGVADGLLRAFVLRLVREPVASARLMPGDGIAALSAIGVAERHRRRGYGQMITAIATRAGLATGNRLVWLSVEESNTPAVMAYRNLGFEPSFVWSRWAAPAD